ncbi:hypothetical protein BpHYR1_041796 [Brachionus plicatilis]|uniref:Uncharacterized protein n=1 Tax=Brachionus plicatilis TaxID=10195 RepID=A0A3M7R1L1_BRAPC|nr:hypothetical protein BpHYR1_041796 [Brachionus plicatilis]
MFLPKKIGLCKCKFRFVHLTRQMCINIWKEKMVTNNSKNFEMLDELANEPKSTSLFDSIMIVPFSTVPC